MTQENLIYAAVAFAAVTVVLMRVWGSGGATNNTLRILFLATSAAAIGCALYAFALYLGAI